MLRSTSQLHSVAEKIRTAFDLPVVEPYHGGLFQPRINLMARICVLAREIGDVTRLSFFDAE
jgi:hypothetical protein